MTRVRVEPTSCNQARKNDAFILLATLLTYLIIPVFVVEAYERCNLSSCETIAGRFFRA